MIALIALRRGTCGGSVGEIGFSQLVAGAPVIVVRQSARKTVVALQVVGSLLALPVVLIASRCAELFAKTTAHVGRAPTHITAPMPVDTVDIGKDHHRVSLRQAVRYQFTIVVLLCLVTSLHVAIPAVEEAGFDAEVEHHVLLAVVLARALA